MYEFNLLFFVRLLVIDDLRRFLKKNGDLIDGLYYSGYLCLVVFSIKYYHFITNSKQQYI
jgi:hypothetical protein